jgi:putative ABC transport system substrate-binding protein
MDRRAFIATVTGSLLAAPLAVAAQQQPRRTARIGYLALSELPNAPGRAAFQDGLRELGWIEGQNLTVELRVADGNRKVLSEQAAELVRLNPDVLVAASSLPAQALMKATNTIPIVVAASSDPLEDGLVTSLARPGGNITGLSLALEDSLTGKWLELLKEAISTATRFAVLLNPTWPGHVPLLTEARLVGRSLSVRLDAHEVRSPEQFDGAFAQMTRGRADGLIVFPSTTFTTGRTRLAQLAVKHRLPTMFENRLFTEEGGLLSYGPNILALYQRGAFYVDRILTGVRPADLPIEQPTKFELVINLKTAKALGLTIPQSLLQRVDQVIE